MSSSIIAIIIAAITIVLFMWNKLPMSVVAMGSSVAMGILIRRWIFQQYMPDLVLLDGQW